MKNTKAIEKLEELREEFSEAEVLGWLIDEPEGNRYVKLSETLLKKWIEEIGKVLDIPVDEFERREDALPTESPLYSINVVVTLNDKQHRMKDSFKDLHSLDMSLKGIDKNVHSIVDNSGIFKDQK